MLDLLAAAARRDQHARRCPTLRVSSAAELNLVSWRAPRFAVDLIEEARAGKPLTLADTGAGSDDTARGHRGGFRRHSARAWLSGGRGCD
jgi:hypothetical protein